MIEMKYNIKKYIFHSVDHVAPPCSLDQTNISFAFFARFTATIGSPPCLKGEGEVRGIQLVEISNTLVL